ncbi:MAG TPA: HAD family hydrolase [Candidatus Binatus sp.]|nr:HAD family hydrolase [Candidatus Binatus sp.]
MMLRLVAFDLDDTLFPERDYVRSGLEVAAEWVLRAYGRPDFAETAWALFLAGVRGRLFDAALGRLGLPADPAAIAALVDVYRHHRPAITLFPDVERGVGALGERVRLAIVSDGPLPSQQRKVRALRLEDWFDPILLTDRWGRAFWKPHDRAFREIERLTGARGGECVYVGDNPRKDFVAPRALGWRTIRVRRPGGEHAAVGAAGAADVECNDVEEAVRLLGLGRQVEEEARS